MNDLERCMNNLIGPDPVGEANRHFIDEYDYLLPVCANCGEQIQQETAVYIDGKWYCDACLKDMRQCVA